MTVWPKEGVVYLAFGDRWQAEAQRSLMSLRTNSPGVAAAVITDRPWKHEPQPDAFVVREAIAGFRCKPVYLYEAAPFESNLFLDTDTVVARDLAPAFGLLRHFDIGVRFGGPQLNEPDGLELHTQCNSGVVLFRKNAVTEALFRDWLAIYDAAAKSTGTPNVGDQRYLAIAIARSAARPVHLAEYFNFALFETILTYSPPLVYHGRAPWIETLAVDVVKQWPDTVNDYRPRLWISNIAGMLPSGIRHSDPILALAIILRRGWNELRYRFGPHRRASRIG